VQVTVNGGGRWTNVGANLPGLAAGSVISHVEASRANADTAYVAADRHMFDDFSPYIFKTTDGGKTFVNIAGDLPRSAYVQVVKEDPKNPQLLYAGTELGLFVSYEGGVKWQPLLMKNMPRVAVHDLLVHPRDNDLVVATHGRGIAIFDDAAAIQQMTPAIAAARAHLFAPREGLRINRTANYAMMGDDGFYGPNPPAGALLTYHLAAKPAKEKPLKLHIFDASGVKVAEVKNPAAEAGLNRAAWNLRFDAPKPRREATGAEADAEGGRGGATGAVPALPGRYTVKLLLGDEVLSEQPLVVKVDPTIQVSQADLQQQFDQCLKLRHMITGVTDALRDLDRAKSQLESNEKLAPASLKPRLAEMKKELEAAIARFDAGGVRYRVIKAPRLSEELGPVFSAIANGNSAPTAAQAAAAAELAAIYATESRAHNQFIATALPAWSEELRKQNLLGFTPAKPIPPLP